MDALSEREIQVLCGVARGLSNAAIGWELVIAEDTVRTHVTRLLRKVGASNRAHAVALGYEVGVLRRADPLPPELAALRMRVVPRPGRVA